MKDAIIIGLVLLLAILALGTSARPEAVMQARVADWPVCVRLNPNGPVVAPKQTIHGKGHPEWS